MLTQPGPALELRSLRIITPYSAPDVVRPTQILASPVTDLRSSAASEVSNRGG